MDIENVLTKIILENLLYHFWAKNEQKYPMGLIDLSNIVIAIWWCTVENWGWEKLYFL